MNVTLEGVNLDLTQVLVAFVTVIPAIIAALYARSANQQIKTPSGDTLGAVAERTHDMTAAGVAIVSDIKKTVRNGVHVTPPPKPPKHKKP